MRRLAPWLLFGFALAVRALPWPQVFDGGRVHFAAADAYYHMRRILYALEHFPRGLDFDPYVNFPHGARTIWPPAFDLAIAAALRPFWPASELTIERLAAWIPPLLGASTVLALYALALRHCGFAVALGAAVVLSVLPGHFAYSQLGYLDHHVAVSLLSTLLLAIALDTLRLLLGGRPPPRSLIGAAALAGLASALLLLVWPGGLLQVAVVELAWLAALLSRRDRAAAVRACAFLGVAHGAALLALAPAAVDAAPQQWSAYSPVVLSRFQPWLAAALLAFATGCGLLWHAGAGRSRARRAGQALAIGLSLLLGSALLFPELLAGLGDAWRWLARGETFQGMVAESEPLLGSRGRLDFGVAERRLSRFVYLAPLALLALASSAQGRPERPLRGLLAGWSLALAAAALLQQRFVNSLAPAFALLLAWSGARAWAALPARWRTRSPRAAAVVATFAFAGLWLFAPVLEFYAVAAGNQLRALRGRPPVLPRPAAEGRERATTARWLRRHTPPTAGFFDADVRPEYGVLSVWGLGHAIEYLGRRPANVDNFGDDLGPQNFQQMLAYLRAPTERDAVRILEGLRARYVVVPPAAGAWAGIQSPSAMLRRLYDGDGSGLARHRLLYETPPLVGGARARSPWKVFEFVRGALVVGRAPPAARVTARLAFETNRGREGRYETSARADAGGRYRLRLPYATRGAPPALRPAASYRLEAGGRRGRLAIHESEVRTGTEVAGPDLRAFARPSGE